MKRIEKGREPRSFESHRANGGDFKGLPRKVKEDDLREQLLNEQGHICCYCMKRIPQTLTPEQVDKNFPSSKIEHVLSQENHPDQQLNYQNLLIACNGNHGQPNKTQTCDTYKGERDLSFNPADRIRDIELFIKYLPNGEIRSNDQAIDRELKDILNLNTLDLRNIRAEHFKKAQERIQKIGSRYPGKVIPKRIYEDEKQALLAKMNGRFPQYCMVSVYLLNKKLSRIK